MNYSFTDNVRKLLPGKAKNTAPPAKQPQKSTYQKNIDAHFNMQNDGLDNIRHLPDMDRLIDILSLNRCANGPGLKYMLDKYLNPAKEYTRDDYRYDGNRFLTIPQSDGTPPRIAFTSHCDTMSDDRKALYHPLKYNRDKDILFRTDGNCLGADDGTGVWLMLNMIDARVPGLYCFFLDEETGRQGSEWSWKNDKARYDGIDTVISFDRMHEDDIIATQRGDDCCSDAFQYALADLLSSDALKVDFVPGAKGSFTDSATFMEEIAECTNVSIGYDKQHSPQETQLVGFASKLMSTMRLIGHFFHERLPVKRDAIADTKAKQAKSVWPGYGGGYYHGYGGLSKPYNPPSRQYEEELDAMAAAQGFYDVEETDMDDLPWMMSGFEYKTLQSGTLMELIEIFPDAIESLILDMGWDEDEVAEHIAQIFFAVKDIRNANIDTTH